LTRKSLIFFCLGLIVGAVFYGQYQLLENQQQSAPHSELILALEEINRPVDFCGTPRLQAIETVKNITGLDPDKVIEMAANYARYVGIPENAYQEERLMNLGDRVKILNGDDLDANGVGQILDREGNVLSYEIMKKPI
jgi:hypothetical protein